MKYGKYGDLVASDNFLEYELVSVGPKGDIRKIVQFLPTSDSGIYNLSFGNIQADREIDDRSVDDNKDRDKILATVVQATTLFFREYPDVKIIFSGSTPHRTRLYRMAISLNLEELSAEFEIFGLLMHGESYAVLSFQTGVDYFGFLVKKKNVNL